MKSKSKIFFFIPFDIYSIFFVVSVSIYQIRKRSRPIQGGLDAAKLHKC